MDNKYDIAKDWLPRYTGMPVDDFGDYILLTNFQDYVEQFADRFFEVLLMNVFAPTIDHYIIESNVKRREKRIKTQLKTA